MAHPFLAVRGIFHVHHTLVVLAVVCALGGDVAVEPRIALFLAAAELTSHRVLDALM